MKNNKCIIIFISIVIVVMEINNLNNQKTLVLICALMCDQRLFESQQRFLQEFCSVKILVINNFTNINEAAEYILHKLVLEKEFYLAGISMGGYIAMEIASIAPERIKKLCLMATRIDDETNDEKQKRQLAIEEAINNNKATATKSFLGKFIFNSSNDKIDLLIDMNNKLGVTSYVNQQKLILSKNNLQNKLLNFTKPCIVIAAENDQITPPIKQEQIKNTLTNSNLITINNCGHLIPLDQPHKLNLILQQMIND
ncbi:alpha/beta fold hydrolase [Rickettsiales bacterium LUAb2]